MWNSYLSKWFSAYSDWYENSRTIVISEPFFAIEDQRWKIIYGNATSYQLIESETAKKAEAEFNAAVNLAMSDHGFFYFRYIFIPRDRATRISDIYAYLDAIQSLRGEPPHLEKRSVTESGVKSGFDR